MFVLSCKVIALNQGYKEVREVHSKKEKLGDTRTQRFVILPKGVIVMPDEIMQEAKRRLVETFVAKYDSNLA